MRTSAELSRAARQAAPGDLILVAPGKYRSVILDAKGAPAAPIVIAGEKPDDRPVFAGMLYLPDAAWLTLRDLAIEAEGDELFNGINADDGGDGVPSRGLRFERIRFEVGAGNGLKLAGVDDFVVRDCEFVHWSKTALDMVGCHRGLIRECSFEAAQEVFHGVQIKGGSSDVVVRDSRFEGPAARWINIGGGTSPELFRPRDARYEAANILVESNWIIGGAAAIVFDAAIDSTARNNILQSQRRFVFRILNSSRGWADFEGCRDGAIENNFVLYRSDAIEAPFNLGYGADWRSFRLSSNIWHDETFARIPSWRGWLRWILPSLWDLPAPESGGRYGPVR